MNSYRIGTLVLRKNCKNFNAILKLAGTWIFILAKRTQRGTRDSSNVARCHRQGLDKKTQ